MSGDEVFAFLFSGIVALIYWIFWYFLVLSPARPGRAPLSLLPVVCPICCFLLLRRFADVGVRESFNYQLLYTTMGAAWVGLAAKLSEVFDISMRDDAVERRNRSAVAVARGALVALWLAYTGGNFGDGPGWWVVLYCAALSTGILAVVWLIVEVISGLSERVTLDRDLASGVRFGGLLAAAGLVLGRGAAGDWVSSEAAVSDMMRIGWPVLAAGGLEALLGLALPRASKPDAVRALTYGYIPAAAYGVAAVAWVVSQGAWK